MTYSQAEACLPKHSYNFDVFWLAYTSYFMLVVYKYRTKQIIIHPVLLTNQSARIAPGDSNLKCCI